MKTDLDRLSALGDGTRRAIFEQLAEGPAAVGQLASGLPVTRPAVSQHLKVLKGAGLVRDRRQGTRRIYEVDLRGVSEIRAYLDRFWDTALASFKTVVESPEARASEPLTKATAVRSEQKSQTQQEVDR